MDKSLDELVRERRSSGRGGRGGARRGRDDRHVERPRYNNGGNKFGGGRGGKERRRRPYSGGRLTPFSRPGTSDSVEKWGHDGFEQLQRQPSPPRHIHGDVGYKLKITNLHYDVIEDDLIELFSTVGEVVSAKVKYDNAGRSTGEATVVLKSQSAVQKAIDEFDGRAIDNQKMRVEEAGTVELGEKKRAPRVDDRDIRPKGDEPRPRGRGFTSGTRGLLGEFAKDNDRKPRGRDARYSEDELKNLKVQVSF